MHAPIPQFYTYPPGEFTPFGEQMMLFAESLSAQQRVDPQAIADHYAHFYSRNASARRPYASYVDNATRSFLDNVRAGRRFPHTGGGDTETNACAHALPVIAMRAGRPGVYFVLGAC